MNILKISAGVVGLIALYLLVKGFVALVINFMLPTAAVTLCALWIWQGASNLLATVSTPDFIESAKDKAFGAIANSLDLRQRVAGKIAAHKAAKSKTASQP